MLISVLPAMGYKSMYATCGLQIGVPEEMIGKKHLNAEKKVFFPQKEPRVERSGAG